MHRELREQIRKATEQSGINKLDFIGLLKQVDDYYERLESTITQAADAGASIEVIFDSVTDALMSVGSDGIIRHCNQICSCYFNVTKEELIGSAITRILPGAKDRSLSQFLSPFMSNLNDTHPDLSGGEVGASRADGAGARSAGSPARAKRDPPPKPDVDHAARLHRSPGRRAR